MSIASISANAILTWDGTNFFVDSGGPQTAGWSSYIN